MTQRTQRQPVGWLATLNRVSPALAVAALIAMFFVAGPGAGKVSGSDEYAERVRAAIERIPYQIGDWVGKDIEVPAPALKLLKPNKIMQRRYVDPSTGRTISVLVVHCGDVRDMRGHYPPVCYPAHGWDEVREQREASSVSVSGGVFPARNYMFRRVVQGVEQSMGILSFFVLPDPRTPIAEDMRALDRRAQIRSTAALGSAQVQIVGAEQIPGAEREKVINQFMRALEPAIRAVASGVTHAAG